jgi:hypothetical protein
MPIGNIGEDGQPSPKILMDRIVDPFTMQTLSLYTESSNTITLLGNI